MTLADDIDAAGCGMGSCLGVPFKCLRISKEAGGAAGMLHPSLQLLLCHLCQCSPSYADNASSPATGDVNFVLHNVKAFHNAFRLSQRVEVLHGVLTTRGGLPVCICRFCLHVLPLRWKC